MAATIGRDGIDVGHARIEGGRMAIVLRMI